MSTAGLRAHVEAWKRYDREQIGALFAEDVKCRYHPYDDPVEGRQAVVSAWLGDGSDPGVSSRDQPVTYGASYDRDIAVATGTTSYLASPGGPVEKVYDNCFVVRFR
jgi:ketosteroid isomerase-like protein